MLEITERPEIHSGAFHFAFDPDRSEALLQGIIASPPKLVFRLPHAAKPDPQVRKMRASGFVTIIKLPFKDEESRRVTEERLKALPHYFMLLTQHLRVFEAQFRDGRVRRLVRRGGGLKTDGGRAILKIGEGEDERAEEWRVWSRAWPAPTPDAKRLSAAIAVQVNGRSAVAAPDEIPFHVFYPTEELVLAPFLVHASFELRSDRNHLLAGDHDQELLGVLGELAKAVVSYLPPASILELFRNLAKPPPANVKRLDKKIQRALGQAVVETAFVPVLGGGKVQPAKVRIWAHELASVLNPKGATVREARLCAPALTEVFPVLRAYGAEPLGTVEYAELLFHAKCYDLDSCIRAARVAQQGCLSGGDLPPSGLATLARAPFWLTRDRKVRPLDGARSLVRSRPSVWPDWLVADDLDPDFARAVLGTGQSVDKAWSPLVEGRLLQSLDELLIHCLAPAMQSWTDREWADRGWEALAAIQAWKPGLEWVKIRPYVPKLPSEADPARAALAPHARVPRGTEWVSACDAYAGPEIGGNSGLADFFREQPVRVVVGMPPRAKAFGRGGWRALLRYLGVSWEPKIRWYDNSDVGFTCGSRFWAEVREEGLNWRRRDWFLDFFPECMQLVPPQGVAKMLGMLLPVTSQLSAAYSKRSDADRTHRPHPFASCVDYQLRRERYLPCRASFAHPSPRGVPKDLYWHGRGIPGITPMVDLGGLPIPQRQRLRSQFVQHLGVQEDLPDPWGPWLHWADQVAEVVETGEIGLKERMVRDFYEQFLRWKFTLPKPRAIKRVVCATRGGLKAVPAAEAVWINDPKLAAPEIQGALIDAGLAVFPAALERGEGSVARLGVRCATDVVEVRPRFTEASPRETARLTNRLKERRHAFAAVCEIKQEEWRDPATIRAVWGLSLTFSVNNQDVATRAALAFRDDGSWLVSLDAGHWDALAVVCASGFRYAAYLRHWFAAILKAGSSDEIAAILLDGGIPTYRLREIVLPDETSPEEADEFAATPPPESGANLTATPGSAAGQSQAAPVEVDEREDDEDWEPPDRQHFTASSGSVGGGAGRPPADGGSGAGGTRANVASPGGRLRKRPLYDEPRQDRSERGHGSGRAAAAAAAANAAARGLAAEAWFAERIQETLPDGWHPQFNVRDVAVRESDVILSLADLEWHVELKCLTSERIFWSQLEQRKAAALPDRFLMAFLIPEASGEYRAHWSWDPLKDLLVCERRVDWVWSDTGQGPPLPPDSWEPLPGLKRPERPPSRMNFAVHLREEFLRALPHDDRTLTTMWARLVAPMKQAAE